jgi:hypothetical protein
MRGPWRSKRWSRCRHDRNGHADTLCDKTEDVLAQLPQAMRAFLIVLVVLVRRAPMIVDYMDDCEPLATKSPRTLLAATPSRARGSA